MSVRRFPGIGLAGLVVFAPVVPATAAVTIDWVSVGNPGNAADTTGFGRVDYAYRIARNETTIGQYAEFLNAVAKTDPYKLYNSNLGSASYIAGISRSGVSGNYSYAVIAGTANKPITWTSWFDAARFCNWLHNGQPTGAQGAAATEDGAYTLLGAMSGIHARTAGAKMWIPSEDEWYKAAYYDPTKGGVGGYWLYPTQSDTIAGNTAGVPGSANYYDGDYVGYPGMALTDGGTYGANSDSFFGTSDQGGNVWEWNDAVMGSSRGMRGGCWDSSQNGAVYLASSFRSSMSPVGENYGIGFRLATVPEPSAGLLTALACGVAITRRQRRSSPSRPS